MESISGVGLADRSTVQIERCRLCADYPVVQNCSSGIHAGHDLTYRQGIESAGQWAKNLCCELLWCMDRGFAVMVQGLGVWTDGTRIGFWTNGIGIGHSD